ncbi:MAG: hypothetical protein E7458_00045 [Ruminococcaceae bacterium]|nr:hypothetical protein [Oscillospiraceae bacterium]
MEVTSVRNEFRRYVTHGELIPILARLQEYVSYAPHTDERGRYHVRSLYFGRQRVRASRIRRLHGARVDQYFIRYYENDLSTLRLCRESRIDRRVELSYTPLTEEQCRRILDRDIAWMRGSEDPLLQEFLQKLMVEEFVTKNVVDGDKIVLESHVGSVRICVDINLRTSNRAAIFLDPEAHGVPLDGARTLVLRVKYDDQLQEPIRSIVGYGSNR